MSDQVVLDPTAEAAPVTRKRRPPSVPIASATVGLFSIAKERSNEFMDYMEALLVGRGYVVKRFAKATHTKTAAPAVLADMVAGCDVVIGGLAD
jgi:hypothetical protein